MSKYMEIHIIGENLAPESLRASKLAEILLSTEDLLASVSLENHEGLTKEQLLVSLVQITTGSIGLQFTSSLPEVVDPAFERVAKAIQENRPADLPVKSREPLAKLIGFLRQNNAIAEMNFVNGSIRHLATLTSEFSLPKRALISGITTIYGEIVRVGGKDPTVEFTPINGTTIYCQFGKELAAELGSRLYKIAGLIGEAEWDFDLNKLISFNVTGITPYESVPIDKAFHDLQEIAGKYFDDIPDVNAYIEELRRDE